MTHTLTSFVEALKRTDRSAPDEVFRAFDEQREDLVWLAAFLLAHWELTDVCLLDAVDIVLKSSRFKEHPTYWTHRAVLQSAIEMQQRRIAVLAAIYQQRTCWHTEHAWIEPDLLKRLTIHGQVLVRLDTLCRFALASRSVENLSVAESAAILGVSEGAVNAAYCTGIEVLTGIARELLEAEDEYDGMDVG